MGVKKLPDGSFEEWCPWHLRTEAELYEGAYINPSLTKQFKPWTPFTAWNFYRSLFRDCEKSNNEKS